MRHNRLILVVVGLLGIGVGAVGLGQAGSAPRTSSDQVAPRKSNALRDNRTAYTSSFMKDVASPESDPEATLSSVLRRYGGERVLAASVDAREQGVSLHFVVSAPTLEGGRAIRAQWESDLIEGAVADVLADGANRVVTSQIDVRLPDGSTLKDVGGGIGDILPGQNFSTASDSSIRSDINEGLTQANLVPDSLDILRASQPAPAVIATTSDSTNAAQSANDTIRSLFGQDPPVYEGYYFEIRDADGEPVLVQAASFRSGSGRLWVSPRVEAVSSLNHG